MRLFDPDCTLARFGRPGSLAKSDRWIRGVEGGVGNIKKCVFRGFWVMTSLEKLSWGHQNLLTFFFERENEQLEDVCKLGTL